MAMSEQEMITYLRDLAERLMHVPAKFGVDGWDVDQVNIVASTLEEKEKQHRIPVLDAYPDT